MAELPVSPVVPPTEAMTDDVKAAISDKMKALIEMVVGIICQINVYCWWSSNHTKAVLRSLFNNINTDMFDLVDDFIVHNVKETIPIPLYNYTLTGNNNLNPEEIIKYLKDQQEKIVQVRRTKNGMYSPKARDMLYKIYNYIGKAIYSLSISM